MCGYFPMPESNNEKGSRKAPFSFINSGLQEITMALILDMGPDGKGGEILHPMLVNKWRLEEWTAGDVEHDMALTLQAISLQFTEQFKWFKKNELHIVFEEDVGAYVATALNALINAGKGSIVVNYLDGTNAPLKTVIFHGVKIVSKHSYVDYAASAAVKAYVTCTFKKSELVLV